MSWKSGKNGKDKEYIQKSWFENIFQNAHLEDRKGNGRMIQTWILGRYVVRIEGG
jgi:hypothetical protein